MQPKRLMMGLLSRVLAPCGIALTPRRRSRVYAWFPDGRIQPASPDGGFYFQPCIHPLGRDVVYHGNNTGPLRLWRTDLATGATLPLSPAETTAVHPVYSWDGTQLVFASDRDWDATRLCAEQMTLRANAEETNTRLDLYQAPADGGEPRRLTFDGLANRRPSFSPDGRQVVFISRRGGQTDLWVLDTSDPSRARCLAVAPQGMDPRRPWFAADGTSIYFCGQDTRGHRHRICRIPIEGGTAVPLANDVSGMSHGPYIQAGGNTLLMHARHEGKFNLWELPLDGSPARPLSPPGFRQALHATRASNGTLTFDVPSIAWHWGLAARRRDART